MVNAAGKNLINNGVGLGSSDFIINTTCTITYVHNPLPPFQCCGCRFFLFPHESPICVLGLPNAVGTNIEYGGAGEKCLKACSVFIKFFPAAWLARCLNAKGVINKSRVDII